MLIVGGTAGVIVLALIAFFMSRPSGNSNTSGPTADATASQPAVNPPAPPSSVAASPAKSAAPPPPASMSASPSSTVGAAVPTNTVAVNVAQVHVAVYNGSDVNQRAANIKTALVNKGFSLATVGGTLASTPSTKVYYPAGRVDSAAAVANALAIPAADLSQSTTYSQVTVVIGTDWASGNTYPAG